MTQRELLAAAAEHAGRFLDSLPERPVGRPIAPDELRATLGGPLPDAPTDPRRVLDELVAAAEPGLVASAGPRYFGFVIGGAVPAALATDWLAAAWDQDAGNYVAGPAAAVVEEVAAAWLRDLLGLPATASAGFVTGGQMANATGLAAARHHVLAREGWDVARNGLIGAPRVRVVVGEQRHVTIDRALRLLGLGDGALEVVPADDQGRMVPHDLRAVLARGSGPTIVCAQAGEVNTGAFDRFDEIADAVATAGAWLHVDGAFGLWAAASSRLRPHVEGVERADSWAVDAHKWLNVPYDCGLAFCRDPDAHAAAMALSAAYLVAGADARDPYDWTPEASRRARGFAVYAALRSLGRSGVAELVDRCCSLARRFATALEAAAGVEILNEVVLNQVLAGFDGGDARTDEIIRRVQEDGVCWLGGTTWRGRRAMRISVSNWRTTEEDVDRAVESILAAAAATA